MSGEEPARRSVLVAGGGISGLAAAHRLHELAAARGLPLTLTLLEAGARLGGCISSVRREGFLLEEGPDSMITDRPWGRALAERIGLGGRLVGTQAAHRRSFVVRRGRLEPTPEGFYLLAPSAILPLALGRIFSPLGVARMALEPLIPRRRSGGDESVGSFVRRRLGRQVLDRIAQPMVAGIYGADPDRLSLMATFPRFLQMEKEHGSVVRAMVASRRGAADRPGGSADAEGSASGARYGLFVSFDGGLQVLTEALAGRLPPGRTRTRSRLESLTPLARTAGYAWRAVSGGRPEEFDAVVLALPAYESAALVRPFDASLAEMLGSIAYASAATVSLAFRERDVSHPMDGFGFVVPSVEGLSLMGCTFAHRKYPGRAPEGHALVRAFWGDAGAGLDDGAILERTLRDLTPLLGLRDRPALVHVARWRSSMPQYTVGHLDRVARIEARAVTLPGLALAGNAYRGIGIPDCIRGGEAAAEAVFGHLFHAGA